MIKKYISISAIMLCFTCTMTFAQGSSEMVKTKKKVFENFDADKDGKFNLSEFTEMRKAALTAKGKKVKGDFSKRFNKMDADADGFLTKEEFRMARKKRKKAKDK